MNKSLLVECPKCGAKPGQRCTKRGFEMLRTHQQRLFQAERELNGGMVFTATDEATMPRRVKCPSCGAEPGELCMRISRKADNEAGWEYCTPNSSVRKNNYCNARWNVVKGTAEYDIEESAAETGLWAGDAESAADNGLLAEVINDEDVGEPALSTRQKIEMLVANRAKDAEEQARRRKVLNWGKQGGDA